MFIAVVNASELEGIGFNEFPYMPFPSSWPVYSPAPKVRLSCQIHGLSINLFS